MIVDLVTQSLNNLDNKTIEWCEPITKYLDDHPRLYKICVVAIHIFRASCMYALMELSSLPLLTTCGLMAGASVLYRAAIERYCAWKFAIPSMIGGMAIWAAKSALIAIVAHKVFLSLGATIGTALGILSLVSYIGWICYLSHKDIENHLAKNKGPEEGTTDCQPCCSTMVE